MVAGAAALALVWTVAGCNGDDEPRPDADALANETIERGGSRYALSVQQGTAETIGEVIVDGSGPTVWGSTDFERSLRHLGFAVDAEPSAVVDGERVFARPGDDPAAWGVADADDETLARLDLSQLIALHDPGALLRLVASADGATAGEDTEERPGHHNVRGLPIDDLDDPVTVALASRLGLATVDVHLWSSDDDGDVVRRLAMPLRLGDRNVAGGPDGALEGDMAASIPELWLVVAFLELGQPGDLGDPVIETDRLEPAEPLRPEDLAARLNFPPFTGLAEMIDPRGVPDGPFVEPGESPGQDQG